MINTAINTAARKHNICTIILMVTAVALIGAPASGETLAMESGQRSGAASTVSAQELSPSFLGMYRKVMLIERSIEAYSHKYDVDLSLARAVCMYESGGNANLRSMAGARGYFQVMPTTYRSMRVRSNIEAGIKYLGNLLRRFDGEERVLAAYNGGPTRVARGRVMPLETQQYVRGVANYRAVLKKYGPLVRKNAKKLGIVTVRRGDNWWRLSRRLKMPLAQLRLYNPFLAARNLRPGYHIVYPRDPNPGLLAVGDDDTLYYQARLGDNIISLAFALGVKLDAFRQANSLQPLEPLAPGTMLEVPINASAKFVNYRVTARDTLPAIAKRMRVDPWTIVRDNFLWSQRVEPGMVLRIRKLPPQPRYAVHRVRRGDTLSSLARRYHTSIRAIQLANSMGRRTRIRIGHRIRIRRR
ncbi:MAG TPA: LysM peptidoglycan-binding domain-containing protein [Candidatus Dormibacteraeota bacterium]|nr:LysM peptidoglycan-binding domain-containing protein [Candidatus Dormibacteraeota bacterium]